MNTKNRAALVTIAALVLFTGIAAAETGELTLLNEISSLFEEILAYFENLGLPSIQSTN